MLEYLGILEIQLILIVRISNTFDIIRLKYIYKNRITWIDITKLDILECRNE